MPVRDSQVSNRLHDMERDLANIASGDRGAPADLMDDLAVFVDSETEAQVLRELGRRLAGVVAAKALPEEIARKLVEQIWIASVAREFSQRQQDTLRDDVRALLMSAGVEAKSLEEVVSQVGDVQNVVSRRTRRWYERY